MFQLDSFTWRRGIQGARAESGRGKARRGAGDLSVDLAIWADQRGKPAGISALQPLLSMTLPEHECEVCRPARWASDEHGRAALVELEVQTRTTRKDVPPQESLIEHSCSTHEGLPRSLLDAAVKQHDAEQHAKGMTCWSQYIAVMYYLPGAARPLCGIIGGLAASEGNLRHLGRDEHAVPLHTGLRQTAPPEAVVRAAV